MAQRVHATNLRMMRNLMPRSFLVPPRWARCLSGEVGRVPAELKQLGREEHHQCVRESFANRCLGNG